MGGTSYIGAASMRTSPPLVVSLESWFELQSRHALLVHGDEVQAVGRYLQCDLLDGMAVATCEQHGSVSNTQNNLGFGVWYRSYSRSDRDRRSSPTRDAAARSAASASGSNVPSCIRRSSAASRFTDAASPERHQLARDPRSVDQPGRDRIDGVPPAVRREQRPGDLEDPRVVAFGVERGGRVVPVRGHVLVATMDVARRGTRAATPARTPITTMAHTTAAATTSSRRRTASADTPAASRPATPSTISGTTRGVLRNASPSGRSRPRAS